MNQSVTIPFKKVKSTGVPFKYMTEGAACADIYSAESLVIPAKTVGMIGTGIAVELPQDYELQIRSRSGLAARGFMIANGIGTVDSDYRGEIRVLIYNSTNEDFRVSIGDRIAQAIIVPVTKAVYTITENLSNTKRNENGFGSTGK